MVDKMQLGTKSRLNFKKYLITGILVWLPIMVSIWVVDYIISASDNLFHLLPVAWRPEAVLGMKIPGLGFIFSILILCLTGLLAANVLGRKIVQMWDAFFTHIPVVKSVYTSVKKVSESLLSDSRQSFKTPVLVQFPHADVWTIGFVSGSIPRPVYNALQTEEDYLSVYVPTTPNPTGGYYIFVKTSQIRALDLSVDEALKYVISLGMVMPDAEPPKTIKPNKKDTANGSIPSI